LWAKAVNGNGKITLTLINPNTFFVYVSNNFTVTDSWAKYTLTYTPSNNITASLNIDLGTQTGIYYLDDINLKKPTSVNSNPIVNYDFSDGKVGWFSNSWWPAVAAGDVINGEYKISINNGGVNVWDIFLGQGDLLIEKGKEYTVSFDAYADAPRTISALVGMNSSPWTVYSGNNIKSITTSKQTYTYSFVMNSTTDNQARLGFDVGGSVHDVYFDNIYLTQSVTSVSAEFSQNYTFTLEQNYPNPFNPTTKISWQSPISSRQILKVFDVLGNEVATIVNEEMEAGYHSVDFNASSPALAGQALPSGVYFYQLRAGEYTAVKKMLLIK
jgi:hypothetical protein